MKTVMLKVNNSELKPGDILEWTGDEFKHISKSAFLSDVTNDIAKLKERDNYLELCIKELADCLEKMGAELAYNRGDISEEEYKRLCGLNK